MTASKTLSTLAFGAVALAAPATLAADAAPATTTLDMKVPTLKLSAVTFFNYGYTLAGEDAVKKQNAFNFERAYVNIEPVLDSTWSARITPDLAKPDAAGKNYGLRLKFAYVDGKKIGDTGRRRPGRHDGDAVLRGARQGLGFPRAGEDAARSVRGDVHRRPRRRGRVHLGQRRRCASSSSTARGTSTSRRRSARITRCSSIRRSPTG
jgi:hypothetical protein